MVGFGAELVNPRAALVGVFPCATGDLNTGRAAFRDDVTPADRGGAGASTLPRGWPANVSDCATLSTGAAGNCLVGNTGFSAAPEESELDCAPPVLCTMPVRGSGVAERIATDEPCVAVDDADGTDGES